MSGCDGDTADDMPPSTYTNPFGVGRCWGSDLFRFSTYVVNFGDAAVTEGGLSLWVYASGSHTYQHSIAVRAGSTNMFVVYWQTDGYVDVGVNGQTTLTDITTADGWHLWDFVWKMHASTGYVQVYCDKVLLQSFTGIDLSAGSAGVDNMYFNSDTYMYCDDLVLWDTAAGGWTSFPTTSHRVRTLVPNGDGAETDWTSTGGSHYTEVDDVGNSDDDTTTLTSSTPGDRDRLDVATYDGGSSDKIVAVGPEVYAKTDVAGTMKIGVRASGGGESMSSAFTPGVGYGQLVHIASLNPDDSSVWEVADLASVQVVLEHVS